MGLPVAGAPLPAATPVAMTGLVPPHHDTAATAAAPLSHLHSPAVSAPFSDAASLPEPFGGSPVDLPRRRLDSFLTTAQDEVDLEAAGTADAPPSPPIPPLPALPTVAAPPARLPFIMVSATVIDRRQPDWGSLAADSATIRSETSRGSTGSWLSLSRQPSGSGAGVGAGTLPPHAHAPGPARLPGDGQTGVVGKTPSFRVHGRPPLAADGVAPSSSFKSVGAVAGSVARAAATPGIARGSGYRSDASAAMDAASPLAVACLEGSADLTTMFPGRPWGARDSCRHAASTLPPHPTLPLPPAGLTIDTLRETCPACDRRLTDADIRAGWAVGSAQDYTTVCPVCPPILPGAAAAGGGASSSSLTVRPATSRGGVAVVDSFGPRGAGASVARRARCV